MSLLIPGTMRAKSVVLMLAVSLAASLSLLGVPSASATTGVTVTQGVSTCGGIYREVVNASSQTIWMTTYYINNGRFEDRSAYPLKIGPGETWLADGPSEKYFSHQFGIKTGVLMAEPGKSATMQWTDWGASTYVPPADCPLVAQAKLWKKLTKRVTTGPKPVIWFKTTAYFTDLGYQVVGKGKRIKWVSTFLSEGQHGIYGPRLKPGRRVKLKFYSRNVDDDRIKTEPVLVAKMRFKRARR